MKLLIVDEKLEARLKRLQRMTRVLSDSRVLLAVAVTKDGLHEGRLSDAAEAYAELSHDEVAALWLAPSKGGVWTTEERRILREDREWRALVHQFRGPEWYETHGL